MWTCAGYTTARGVLWTPLSDAAVLMRLKGLGAFGIDADIQSLQGEEEMVAFCDFVLNTLQTNRDFDLIQGYTGLFIKVSYCWVLHQGELSLGSSSRCAVAGLFVTVSYHWTLRELLLDSSSRWANTGLIINVSYRWTLHQGELLLDSSPRWAIAGLFSKVSYLCTLHQGELSLDSLSRWDISMTGLFIKVSYHWIFLQM